MNWISVLFWLIGSDTVKVLVRKGTRELKTRIGTSIDPELAEAIINDIADSNGNNLGKDLAINIIKEL
jgi:hypothetical protein